MAKKSVSSSNRTLHFRGIPETTHTDWWLTTQAVKVSVHHEFRPGQARSTAQPVSVTVRPDDVIEVEFEEGHRLWISGAEYAARFAKAPSREGDKIDEEVIPDSLDLLPAGSQSRGPIKWAIKSFKVLGIDLERKTARQIGELVDMRATNKKQAEGLYRCSMKTDDFSLTRVAAADLPVEKGKPYLLFLHGTASSTWGSFGELWKKAREREALFRLYEDRVLAFEHPTFTKSPIDNVAKLLSLLPKGISLHLVSHSRGGLIGELLCRVNRSRGSVPGSKQSPGTLPFSEQEIEVLEPKDDILRDLELKLREEVEARYDGLREQLRQLNTRMRESAVAVERFVRVACPALGTTLASRRLDRWVSVMGSIASVFPNTPLFDAFSDIGDFVAAVIKERTNIAELPGLEAMMPESPFIALVNSSKTTLPGDLTVIAGDIQPDVWWAKLMIFSTDRFYDGDHDLVVNTASMYGGALREGTSLVSFHKGAGVNHFSYFANSESAVQIVRALSRRNDETEGFQPLKKPERLIAREVVSRSVEPRPVVFLLPGIMGSELSVGGEKVWVDIDGLRVGGMKKLRINGATITATSPIPQYYEDIIEFLGQTHKVVRFPFDWRLPIEKEADRLAKKLEVEFQEVKAHNLPVRILAHSMGGLVARAMIARHNALWRDICGQTGSRLVLLGTPNGGSHAITQMIVGRSSLMSKLAMVDLTHSHKELIEIINTFPGLLSMLPIDPREDYFSPDTWKQYAKYSRGYWTPPREQDLQKALIFKKLLNQSRLDPAWAIYIAGCAAATPAGMRLNRDKIDSQNPDDPIEFLATSRGDGLVTWDSGIPDNIPTWYMDAEHGDLTTYRDAFPALLELLQVGNSTMTHLLSKTPPISRALGELFPMPKDVEELYPDRDGLSSAALGGGTRRRQRAPRRDHSVRVRVVHGNLIYARYPVAVGHYKGDTIISAEMMLDRELDGALSHRLQIGRYPGALETSAIFVNPRLRTNRRAVPKGAIVIGLGTAGTLSVSRLIKTVHQALIEYALKQSECQSDSEESKDLLGITMLLIGTGAGGLSVSDSVFALLQAVAIANDSLAAANNFRRIGFVDIIELWEDRALQAVECFDNVRRDPELQGRFAFEPFLVEATGGGRRSSFEESGGWWHRLQILGGASSPGSLQGTLRFTATTKRARNEVRLLATQRALVDRFVEQAIRTTQDNRQVSRTLFELLLPNELKEAAPDQDNVVLLLDEDAARYPWELLEDPSGVKDLLKKGELTCVNEQKPFVIRHGVLRQLELRDFREVFRPTGGNKAMVVGDPTSSFVELPGARKEATAVARILENGNFQVETLIRPSGAAVINSLYRWPYRILHLAGHGVYRYLPKEGDSCSICCQPISRDGSRSCGHTPQPVTGMIIGDDMFLSPIEVRQMRQVPELVFINCCHLGKMSDAIGLNESRLNHRQDYNLMAASVAVEFIRMGVRAVVATGWAVDDGAASTFASTFYEHILRGERFGDAVTTARKEAFESHPGINTWGAYQCYGDPDFCVIRDGCRKHDEEDTMTFASSASVGAEINNLATRLKTIGSRDPSWHLGSLRRIEAWLKKVKWGEKGEINLALANAYWEALEYADAIRCYRTALRFSPSVVTLKDIEQFANLLSRACVDAWEKGERTQRSDYEKQMKEADDLLKWLEKSQNPFVGGKRQEQGSNETASERLSLQGGTHKRRAWITTDRKTLNREIEAMRGKYIDAWKQLGAQPKHPYPLMMVLSANLVHEWLNNTGILQRDEFSRGLATARTIIDRALDGDRQFWDESASIDLKLLSHLFAWTMNNQEPSKTRKAVSRKTKEILHTAASTREAEPEAQIDSLANEYQEIRKLGSRRQFASIVDHIKFYEVMASRARKDDWAKVLKRLRMQLEK